MRADIQCFSSLLNKLEMDLRRKSGALVKTVKEGSLQCYFNHTGRRCAALHHFWCNSRRPLTALNTERSHGNFKVPQRKFDFIVWKSYCKYSAVCFPYIVMQSAAWGSFPRSFPSHVCLFLVYITKLNNINDPINGATAI